MFSWRKASSSLRPAIHFRNAYISLVSLTVVSVFVDSGARYERYVERSCQSGSLPRLASLKNGAKFQHVSILKPELLFVLLQINLPAALNNRSPPLLPEPAVLKCLQQPLFAELN